MPVTAVRLTRSRSADGGLVVRLGMPLLDEYLGVPGMPRSNPPAFTCTWAMTGWRRSTARRPRPSTPRPSPLPPCRVPR